MVMGSRFGMVVEVAKETRKKSFLEFGRVCLHIDSFNFSNEALEIEIFGNCFKVAVREKVVLHSQTREEERGLCPGFSRTCAPKGAQVKTTKHVLEDKGKNGLEEVAFTCLEGGKNHVDEGGSRLSEDDAPEKIG